VGGTVKDFWGITEAGWTAIGAIGSLAGSAATFLAVVIALYIANREHRPRMNIVVRFARHGTRPNEIITMRDDNNLGNFVSIYMTNTGLRAIRVADISYSIGFSKARGYESLSTEIQNIKYPIEIESHASKTIYMPVDDWLEAIGQFLANERKRHSAISWSLSYRRFKIYVSIESGHRFKAAISLPMQDAVRNLCKDSVPLTLAHESLS
jgi:hypothetical protein